MIRSLLVFLSIFLTTAHGAKLSIVTDREAAVYQVGETVRFLISAEEAGPFEWTLSRDGSEPITKGSGEIRDGKAVVEGKLDRPGFLRCDVKVGEGKTVEIFRSAAAIEPEKIVPTQTLPDDFMTFWKGKIDAMAAVPMNAELTPVTVKDEGVEVFDVTLQTGGIPVRGYLGRPSGSKGTNLPAMLLMHGAGVRSADLNRVLYWAKQGVLVLDINAHGLPNGRSGEFYAELGQNSYRGYPAWGLDSADENYFTGMFLRVYRALDFLCQQPEWNRKVLIAKGPSQGGAQAIAAAGLHPRVSFLVAIVPAMCEHSGVLTGEPTGWPKMLRAAKGGEAIPAHRIETARYLDMTNFARHIKVPSWMAVGFVDMVCSPTTVYAVWNTLPEPKVMRHAVGMGHAIPAHLMTERDEAVRHHIAHPDGERESGR